MARKILVYVWLLAVLLPTFSQWGTVAYFQLNKDYIARVLCENRDRPELHCDGHCYLARRLKAQQQKQDQQTTEQVRNTPIIQLFTQPLAQFVFSSHSFRSSSRPIFAYQLPAYAAPFSILSPPPQPAV